MWQYNAFAADALRTLGTRHSEPGLATQKALVERLTILAYWLIWLIDLFCMASVLLVGWFYTNPYRPNLVFGGAASGGFDMVRNGLYCRAGAWAFFHLAESLAHIYAILQHQVAGMAVAARHASISASGLKGSLSLHSASVKSLTPSGAAVRAAIETSLQVLTALAMGLLAFAVVEGLKYGLAHVSPDQGLTLPSPVNDSFVNCMLGRSDSCNILQARYLPENLVDVFASVHQRKVPYWPFNEFDAGEGSAYDLLLYFLGRSNSDGAGGGGTGAGGAGGGGRHG